MKDLLDKLKGETDHNRIEQLNIALRMLAEHKSQLEKAQDAVQVAHNVVDRIDEGVKVKEGTYNDPKNLIQNVWEICDQAKVLPPGAAPAKAMVDAAYLVAVQAVSVQQLNGINRNDEDYLRAVDKLSQELKTLGDQLKAHGQPIRPQKSDSPGGNSNAAHN